MYKDGENFLHGHLAKLLHRGGYMIHFCILALVDFVI